MMPPKRKATRSAEIQLPALNIAQLNLEVVGDAPLLSHAWSRSAKDQMLAKQMKVAQPAKEAKNPFRDFVESLYWMDRDDYAPPADVTLESWPEVATQARFGLPTVAFKRAIVSAASFVEAVTKVSLRGALHIDGEMVQIMGKPQVRSDMVRLMGTTADIRFRAEFRQWRTVLAIQYMRDVVSREQVVHLLNVAGFCVGVGDYRPERNGSFGRFHVATTAEVQ